MIQTCLRKDNGLETGCRLFLYPEHYLTMLSTVHGVKVSQGSRLPLLGDFLICALQSYHLLFFFRKVGIQAESFSKTAWLTSSEAAWFSHLFYTLGHVFTTYKSFGTWHWADTYVTLVLCFPLSHSGLFEPGSPSPVLLDPILPTLPITELSIDSFKDTITSCQIKAQFWVPS
jgi:hypothetical protein